VTIASGPAVPFPVKVAMNALFFLSCGLSGLYKANGSVDFGGETPEDLVKKPSEALKETSSKLLDELGLGDSE